MHTETGSGLYVLRLPRHCFDGRSTPSRTKLLYLPMARSLLGKMA